MKVTHLKQMFYTIDGELQQQAVFNARIKQTKTMKKIQVRNTSRNQRYLTNENMKAITNKSYNSELSEDDTKSLASQMTQKSSVSYQQLKSNTSHESLKTKSFACSKASRATKYDYELYNDDSSNWSLIIIILFIIGGIYFFWPSSVNSMRDNISLFNKQNSQTVDVNQTRLIEEQALILVSQYLDQLLSSKQLTVSFFQFKNKVSKPSKNEVWANVVSLLNKNPNVKLWNENNEIMGKLVVDEI